LRESSFVKIDSEYKISSIDPDFEYNVKFDNGCFVFEIIGETKIKYGDYIRFGNANSFHRFLE
jgi:hypothetical protein